MIPLIFPLLDLKKETDYYNKISSFSLIVSQRQKVGIVRNDSFVACLWFIFIFFTKYNNWKNILQEWRFHNLLPGVVLAHGSRKLRLWVSLVKSTIHLLAAVHTGLKPPESMQSDTRRHHKPYVTRFSFDTPLSHLLSWAQNQPFPLRHTHTHSPFTQAHWLVARFFSPPFFSRL